MKIPVQTPIERLYNSFLSSQHAVLVHIADFRQNILSNRDQYHESVAPTQQVKTRDIALVPYESSAKSVDSESFAYAVNASISEGNDDSHTVSSRLKSITQSFFHHPARVLAATIIIILLGYIIIMTIQANSNNNQPITAVKQQKLQ